MLTDEQINKAINRKAAFNFTDKEIEKLWHSASLQKNVELITIKLAYFTSILDAMFLKAFKIDKVKAYKILEIKDYLTTTLQVQRINNLQAELIDNLNLQLFEQSIKYREMEEENINLKKNLDV
tara:strand:- start:119 stop:490 length:372 start_codon:yes stop_codon:yes gene_type:complete